MFVCNENVWKTRSEIVSLYTRIKEQHAEWYDDLMLAKEIYQDVGTINEIKSHPQLIFSPQYWSLIRDKVATLNSSNVKKWSETIRILPQHLISSTKALSELESSKFRNITFWEQMAFCEGKKELKDLAYDKAVAINISREEVDEMSEVLGSMFEAFHVKALALDMFHRAAKNAKLSDSFVSQIEEFVSETHHEKIIPQKGVEKQLELLKAAVRHDADLRHKSKHEKFLPLARLQRKQMIKNKII